MGIIPSFRFAAAGMSDHVSKPIDPFELYAALARASSAGKPDAQARSTA